MSDEALPDEIVELLFEYEVVVLWRVVVVNVEVEMLLENNATIGSLGIENEIAHDAKLIENGVIATHVLFWRIYGAMLFASILQKYFKVTFIERFWFEETLISKTLTSVWFLSVGIDWMCVKFLINTAADAALCSELWISTETLFEFVMSFVLLLEPIVMLLVMLSIIVLLVFIGVVIGIVVDMIEVVDVVEVVDTVDTEDEELILEYIIV